jgi:hypothetical protein
MSSNNTNIQTNEGTFTALLFAIIIGWILVSFWQRVLENFIFGTLGLNDISTFHSLIAALTITSIFIMVLWVLDKYDIAKGRVETALVGEEDEEPQPMTSELSNTPSLGNATLNQILNAQRNTHVISDCSGNLKVKPDIFRRCKRLKKN